MGGRGLYHKAASPCCLVSLASALIKDSIRPMKWIWFHCLLVRSVREAEGVVCLWGSFHSQHVIVMRNGHCLDSLLHWCHMITCEPSTDGQTEHSFPETQPIELAGISFIQLCWNRGPGIGTQMLMFWPLSLP